LVPDSKNREAANFKELLTDYGITPWERSIRRDVVRMSVELMKSSTRNRRFVLVAQTIRYRDVLNTIADALKVKDLTVILNRS
jgi:hypothetical protein